MAKLYDTISRLTAQNYSEESLVRMLLQFARELGWQPSDRLIASNVDDIANAHLMVEHGLENSAVISFLRNRRFSDLDADDRKRLLTLSYNNLVDWHIYVQSDEVTFVYNRRYPFEPKTHQISRSDLDSLRSDAFDKVSGQKPNPNMKALDDALIDSISFWRRNISGELNYEVKNEEFSTLFNTLILVRAAEDNYNRMYSPEQLNPLLSGALEEAWEDIPRPTRSLKEVLLRTLKRFFGNEPPSFLVNENHLDKFEALSSYTVSQLFIDFYRTKYFNYDFSLISKHALSRIYERYVSILRPEVIDPSLTPLFSVPAREETNRTFGGIYTPQYIARFFTKYLRQHMTPFNFKRLKTADPAVGSGIFLRTLLEIQCDPAYEGMDSQSIDEAFHNVFGMDVDANASQATRLSLSLLHLVLTDRPPEFLDILDGETIDFFQNHSEMMGSRDAIFCNPPFISWDNLSLDIRDRYSSFVGEYGSGRIDSYLAFLLLSLKLLKPGGFGLFVLPHSFLLKDSDRAMRNLLSQEAWIHCLVDLSAVKVFGDTGIYVILLIFQKRPPVVYDAPLVTIVKCQEFPGLALQDVLEGRLQENSFYSIYETNQSFFREDTWVALPQAEILLKRRFEGLPKLEDFLQIRQGFTSGNNKVFIVSGDEVPANETELFVPYLSDRAMTKYVTPKHTSLYFFYPYIDGEVINEDKLKADYPNTWQYLLKNRAVLQSRRTVQNGDLTWWRPTRPRPPERMMRPKIVTPHLVLVPRFSLDLEGKYSVSRSPLLYPIDPEHTTVYDTGEDIDNEPGLELDLLKYFVAVLNSTACYWYISNYSHLYQHGYSMLEIKTLSSTPVPNPAKIDPLVKKHLLNLVDERLLVSGSQANSIEEEIDNIVADLYGLSMQERAALGIDR